MKATLLTGHGGVDKLVYGDAPDPVAGPGDVVVDIRAASINAADYKMRLGGSHYAAGNLKFPHILGRDFSGVVSAVGPGVDLKIGDEVVGVTIPGTEGGYAEKIAIKAAIIAKKPAKLSHAEAAAMALTSLTAIWALEDTAKLKKGETVLIQGGAGGVAGFAIQLAKHIGAHVITTASAKNHNYVKKLGADRVIDYQNEDFTKLGRVCDVVFDTVGGEVQVRSYEVLKPGGRLVWIAAAPAGFKPSRDDVQVLRPKVDRDRAHLDRMAELLAAGAVWPPAITRYKLEQAAEAHRVSEGRHLQGKLVLEVPLANASPRERNMAGNGQTIIDLDRKRMTAMAEKDIRTLNEIISDELVYTHSSARLDTKQSLIGNMESGSTVYTSVVPSNVKAQDLGDTVVLTGECKISVNSGGKANSFGVRFTDVYANKGGRWQMVAWQSTRTPD